MDSVRIGCFSAFWGDYPSAARELVLRPTAGEAPPLDFLVGDLLAEVTMSLLARARLRKGGVGYIPDFVASVYTPLLPALMADGTRVVTNAGGLDPCGLKTRLDAIAAEMAADLPRLPVVAVVYGDEIDTAMLAALAPDAAPLVTAGAPEPCPPLDRVAPLAANVYFGASGIAAALDAGADVVVTGRCVDSALVLGPLLHVFGWAPDAYDLLSAGSLAGHIIECGGQCTGGNFTDWQLSAAAGPPDASWATLGFPIATVWADGSCAISKLPGTGGLVTVATVAEQIVYEIGDPAAYILPDVVCDWRDVALEQVAPDVVAVSGARGRPPTPMLKLGLTVVDGWRAEAALFVPGVDAAARARAVAAAILDRAAAGLAARGLGPFSAVRVETLGAGAVFGPHGGPTAAVSEVVLRIAVKHESKAALAVFGKQVAPAATGMAPGLCSAGLGRPRPGPAVVYASALVPKAAITSLRMVCGDAEPVAVADPIPHTTVAPAPPSPLVLPNMSGKTAVVPLEAVAYARSGDKGDAANIGVVARTKALYPVLCAQVTAERVAEHMAHLVEGNVEGYRLPGFHALNFVLGRALGGGGIASLRVDRQGKTYGQVLLRMPVTVPVDLIPAPISKL